MTDLNHLFRGQTRRYGEKKNLAGDNLDSLWAFGPGLARGNGSHSIIYGITKGEDADSVFGDKHSVYTDTLGVSSGRFDKNGSLIFTGDIVEFVNKCGFDCYGIVKFGAYNQDGSDGEYPPTKCLGFYVDVNTFTCPDYFGPEDFPEHLEQQGLLEICCYCEVIGNVFDNPDLLEVAK